MAEHICRNPHCERARKEWALTCQKCWSLVPKELKLKLRETPHTGIARGIAAYAIINWFADHQQELEL